MSVDDDDVVSRAHDEVNRQLHDKICFVHRPRIHASSEEDKGMGFDTIFRDIVDTVHDVDELTGLSEENGECDELISLVNLLDISLETTLDIEIPDEDSGGLADDATNKTESESGGHHEALCLRINPRSKQFHLRGH